MIEVDPIIIDVIFGAYSQEVNYAYGMFIMGRLIIIVLLFVNVAFSAVKQEQLAGPPCVVVFLSDDQGWGDLSCNGNRELATPNVDSLAEAGAKFTSFFVCPVC